MRFGAWLVLESCSCSGHFSGSSLKQPGEISCLNSCSEKEEEEEEETSPDEGRRGGRGKLSCSHEGISGKQLGVRRNPQDLIQNRLPLDPSAGRPPFALALWRIYIWHNWNTQGCHWGAGEERQRDWPGNSVYLISDDDFLICP
ncbi:Hypothetical predicted protein [Podarcis lilfordi]|nr:Hypothetical predicted protein [Podarcis lilfordi]